MSAAPAVWIVLVNWNGWRDSLECLESVFRLDYPQFRVVVCDNGSADGSVEAIANWAAGTRAAPVPAGPLAHLSWPPWPKPIACAVLDAPVRAAPPGVPLLLVRTGANLGFAGGNNIGIRLALADPACRFVWLLNNDTVVEPACLRHMVEAASADAAIGITGSVNCFYAEPERVQALGGGRFWPRRVSGALHGHRVHAGAITAALWQRAQTSLDWISGASMLVSRRFLERIGEMDERYFLYFEEIDWALRARAEFKNALARRARLYHKAGSATGERSDNAFSVYTQCRARFKLYRKMMPGLLPVCYLRTVKDFFSAALRGRRASAGAILRAGRDDLLRR